MSAALLDLDRRHGDEVALGFGRRSDSGELDCEVGSRHSFRFSPTLVRSTN